jgi:hypothetical protein
MVSEHRRPDTAIARRVLGTTVGHVTTALKLLKSSDNRTTPTFRILIASETYYSRSYLRAQGGTIIKWCLLASPVIGSSRTAAGGLWERVRGAIVHHAPIRKRQQSSRKRGRKKTRDRVSPSFERSGIDGHAAWCQYNRVRRVGRGAATHHFGDAIAIHQVGGPPSASFLNLYLSLTYLHTQYIYQSNIIAEQAKVSRWR